MSEEKIQKEKYVELTYSILDETGEIRERVDIPVKYIHGHNSGLFPKIERTLEGHCKGDRVEVSLSEYEGFGPGDPNLKFTDELANVPPQFQQIGAEVEMQNDRGEVKKFVVTEIKDDKLTVDGNHPLAGQTIKFVIDIVEVRNATDDELTMGVTQNFTTGNDGTLH